MSLLTVLAHDENTMRAAGCILSRWVTDSPRLSSLRQTLTLAGIPEDADPRESLPRGVGMAETIAAETAQPVDGQGHAVPDAVASLPPLLLHEQRERQVASPHEFHVLRTIGQGGMGRVELARQPGLEREVAIKRLRVGHDAAPVRLALIREGRLMGGLEHPNIPPIYVLGRSDDEPVLAMKRIEGVSWAELLRDPEHPHWAELGGDRLERNLEILMQVCQAAHFAHSHQTLHLDIKPDNVMLGRFGEVYLIDWGVARRLEEAQADTTPRIVGTPVYMAPEMTRGLNRTSPATDVYLLGATLHEVVTGQPRHAAETAFAALMQAERSAPHAYPPSVHAELAAIANRACHVDPAQRFSTPLELRHAIAGYLRLRSSLALTEVALERLVVLRERTAEVVANQPLSPALRGAFIECRFGFEQALQKAADNERARQGRREAHALMIDAELTARNAGAAEALMAEIGDPTPAQRERLEQLREALASEAEAHARLQAMERELRPRNESWERTLAILVGSLMWLVVIGGMGLASRMGWLAITQTHNLGFALLFTMGGLGAFVRRKQFFHNRVLKQISTMILAAGFVMAAVRVAAVRLDLPLWNTAIADLAIMGMLMGSAEIVMGKLLHGMLVALAVTAAIVVVGHAPAHGYEVTGLLMAGLNFKLAWDMRPEVDAALGR